MRNQKNLIWLTGDTHGMLTHVITLLDNLGRYAARKLNLKQESIFTKEDVLIILGDFGFLWKQQQNQWESDMIGKLNKKLAFSIAFLDGNHENFDKLSELKEVAKYGSTVGQVAKNVSHLKRGHIYKINSKKLFVMGGGNSCDKGHRTIGIDWWPEELVSLKEKDLAIKNLQDNNYEVDYALTHVAPRNIVSELFPDFEVDPDKYLKFYDPVEIFLQKLQPQIKYSKWFCGHYHADKISAEHNLQVLYQSIYCTEIKSILPLWNEQFNNEYLEKLFTLKGY